MTNHHPGYITGTYLAIYFLLSKGLFNVLIPRVFFFHQVEYNNSQINVYLTIKAHILIQSKGGYSGLKFNTREATHQQSESCISYWGWSALPRWRCSGNFLHQCLTSCPRCPRSEDFHPSLEKIWIKAKNKEGSTEHTLDKSILMCRTLYDCLPK